jgi:transposase-like protein
MMVDGSIPECPECTSTEVVVHTRNVAAFGAAARKSFVSYECVECGRQWQSITELIGQTLKPIRRYS